MQQLTQSCLAFIFAFLDFFYCRHHCSFLLGICYSLRKWTMFCVYLAFFAIFSFPFLQFLFLFNFYFWFICVYLQYIMLFSSIFECLYWSLQDVFSCGRFSFQFLSWKCKFLKHCRNHFWILAYHMSKFTDAKIKWCLWWYV